MNQTFSRRTLLKSGAGVAGAAATATLIGGTHSNLVAAQQASPTTGGQTMTGGFDVGPGGSPEIFNPLISGAGFTWFEKYYSKPVLYDVNFTKIQGELIEKWDITPDAKTYTLHVRDGITWHDGQPFTSADVKFSIELYKNPDSASLYGAKVAGVTGVDTPDPLTAVVHLQEANAAFLDALTFLIMLPEHALKSIAPKDLVKSDWWRTNPIGTGPFKWGSYTPGQYTELMAYDKYWRGKPKLDHLIDRYYPEAGSAVIALRSNAIQFTYLTADEAKSLKSNKDLKIIEGPSQVVNYLGFNMKDPRFQDVRVRQAFLYAIDRKSIVDQLFGGSATVTPCAFSNPAYLDKDANEYAPDASKAKQLLQEANWDKIKGEPIEILTYYTDQLSNDVLVTIQQMLSDAGITVKLRSVDVPTFNSIVASAKFAIMYAGTANGPDPDTMSNELVSTAMPPNGNNRTFVNIPELDTLFAQGRQEVDTAKRAAIYQQACKVMNEQLPYAWLWVSDRFGGVSAKVENFIWTPAPGGGRYYDAAETWSLTS